MKTSMTEEIRKKAEENGVRIYGRLRLGNKSDTLITVVDDMDHKFIWIPLDKSLTVLIFCAEPARKQILGRSDSGIVKSEKE